MIEPIDPRDRWELLRLRVQAMSSGTPRPIHSETSVRILEPRHESGVPTLRGLLDREGSLNPDRAVWITLQICAHLSRLHRAGTVNGDLSPSDMRVDSEDRIEFALNPLAAQARSQTAASTAYISPEEVRGWKIDLRSDIYSLGVLLYEMLTGTLPFTGSDAVAVMNDRLTNDPIPPRVIDEGISPELQEIVYRAIERDPRRRYATISEFAWDLTHPEQVVAVARPELMNWKMRRSPWKQQLWDATFTAVCIATTAVAIYLLLRLL